MATYTLTEGADAFTPRFPAFLGDTIFGLGGDDTITGGTGGDKIHAGLGNDLAYGGAGSDSFWGEGGADTLYGGTGNDQFYLLDWNRQNMGSVIYGGADNDTAQIEVYPPAGEIWVTLSVTAVTGGFEVSWLGATFYEVETLVCVFPKRTNFFGGAEKDIVNLGGYLGNGISLEAGDDTAYVTYDISDFVGPDYLDGGLGNDSLSLDFAIERYKMRVVFDASGIGRVYEADYEASNFRGFETLSVRGSELGDTISAAGRAVRLDLSNFNGAGADSISGGNRADQIWAGAGKDTIGGGGGADTIAGGLGADRMAGGKGADVFVFAPGESLLTGYDVITDFNPVYSAAAGAKDHIDLTAFGGLNFIGSAAFTAAGQVHAVARGGAVWIEVNTAGSTGAEFALRLANLTDPALITAGLLIL